MEQIKEITLLKRVNVNGLRRGGESSWSDIKVFLERKNNFPQPLDAGGQMYYKGMNDLLHSIANQFCNRGEHQHFGKKIRIYIKQSDRYTLVEKMLSSRLQW